VQLEFDEAFAHYAEISVELAEDFRSETSRVLREVVAHPLRWPKQSRRVRRCLFRRRFPHALLYQVGVDHILILAIAHPSRRPGYWRRRVTKK